MRLIALLLAGMLLVQSTSAVKQTDITGYGEYILHNDITAYDFTGWDYKQNLY